MDKDCRKLQFNVALFGRTVQVTMNKEFMTEIADMMDYYLTGEAASTVEKKEYTGFVNDLYSFNMDNEPDVVEPILINKSQNYNIFRFSDTYMLVLTTKYAKDLTALISSIFYEIKNSPKDESADFRIDVVFAFVKRLEMAAYNHFRDLNTPRFVQNAHPQRMNG